MANEDKKLINVDPITSIQETDLFYLVRQTGPNTSEDYKAEIGQIDVNMLSDADGKLLQLPFSKDFEFETTEQKNGYARITYLGSPDSYMEVVDVEKDGDVTYLIAMVREISTIDSQIALIKLSANGTTEWVRTVFEGSYSAVRNKSTDMKMSAGAGRVCVADQSNVWLFSEDGSLIEAIELSNYNQNTSNISSVAIIETDRFIMGTWNPGNLPNPQENSAFISSASLSIQFDFSTYGKVNYLKKKDGYYYAIGSVGEYLPAGEFYDGVTVTKIDNTGNIVWNKEYRIELFDSYKLEPEIVGNILIVPQYLYGATFTGMILTAIDITDGSVIWCKGLPSNDFNMPYFDETYLRNAISYSSDSIYISGPNQDFEDIIVLRIDLLTGLTVSASEIYTLDVGTYAYPISVPCHFDENSNELFLINQDDNTEYQNSVDMIVLLGDLSDISGLNDRYGVVPFTASVWDDMTCTVYDVVAPLSVDLAVDFTANSEGITQSNITSSPLIEVVRNHNLIGVNDIDFGGTRLTSDSFISPIGKPGDIKDTVSVTPQGLYKTIADYDGTTEIWQLMNDLSADLSSLPVDTVISDTQGSLLRLSGSSGLSMEQGQAKITLNPGNLEITPDTGITMRLSHSLFRVVPATGTDITLNPGNFSVNATSTSRMSLNPGYFTVRPDATTSITAGSGNVLIESSSNTRLSMSSGDITLGATLSDSISIRNTGLHVNAAGKLLNLGTSGLSAVLGDSGNFALNSTGFHYNNSNIGTSLVLENGSFMVKTDPASYFILGNGKLTLNNRDIELTGNGKGISMRTDTGVPYYVTVSDSNIPAIGSPGDIENTYTFTTNGLYRTIADYDGTTEIWYPIERTNSALRVKNIVGDTYTVTGDDWNSVLVFDTANPVTLTVPDDATENLATGFNFNFRNRLGGAITIAPTGTDTINGAGTLTNDSTKLNSVYKESSGVWVTVGDMGEPA